MHCLLRLWFHSEWLRPVLLQNVDSLVSSQWISWKTHFLLSGIHSFSL
ncbi:hypothetical protein HanIR_Chr12g0575021 [Helianthus annuus]|nr:hypothetical protein HanIR_Chr12g0575021 [Helianthus annuus]